MLNSVFLAGNSNHEFSLSTNGWLHYSPSGLSGRESLRVAGTPGGRMLALPGRTQDNLEDPAISPDGRRIALRLMAAGVNAGDLWILDRQQETLTRFTVGGASGPVWSRDGRRIAYAVSDPGGSVQPGIYIQNANQTGTPQRILAGTGLTPTSWTMGDKAVVFGQGRRATRNDIGMITLGDSTPRWLLESEFNEAQGQVSPDGRLLAYGSSRTGRYEVYVQPLAGDGASVQVSVDGGAHPRWSPDGRTLYYVRTPSLIAATLETRAGVSVTNRRTVQDGGFTDMNTTNVNWDVFPNGKDYLYIDQIGQGSPRLALLQNWPALVRSMSNDR
jgi:eukaryotic-like serine/threonine-protein kinase